MPVITTTPLQYFALQQEPRPYYRMIRVATPNLQNRYFIHAEHRYFKAVKFDAAEIDLGLLHPVEFFDFS